MRKQVFLSFLLVLFVSTTFAQGWQFVGPDSTSWRNIVQMDVRFADRQKPHIAVATDKGLACNIGSGWAYVRPDFIGHPITYNEHYRSVHFSPWNDSIAFIGIDLIEPAFHEPGSCGGTIRNIFAPRWGGTCQFDGGWVGHGTSLSFAPSPHRVGKVYSWIIDFCRSTNNGLSWERNPISLSYGSAFLVADAANDSILYAGLRRQPTGIYRSTNDGTDWTLVRAFPLNMYAPRRYTDFYAKGDTLLFAQSRFPSVYDSTCGIHTSIDGGATWLHVLKDINVQKIVRSSRQPDVFFAAAQGGIYRSTNWGKSWHTYTSPPPSTKLVDLREDPFSDTLYAATADSGVCKTSLRTLGVEIRETAPTQFVLFQNYPNPFNPVTNIEFRIANFGLVTLKIYDLLGREVATLVNEQMEAGSYERVFDGSGLASGMYLYRLQAGSFVQTRKLLLLR